MYKGKRSIWAGGNSTGLFTNPLTASPLSFTASLPKQKLSRAKSRQLRRLFASRLQNVKKQMKFLRLLTQKLSIIGPSPKNISVLKKVTNWSAAGSTIISTAFSSASLGSALSVVGLPAAIPLGGVGGAFALASSGLIVASKKLDSKIKKHQEIVTLAIAKGETVYRLYSKALVDNQITDREFQLIMDEFSQYNVIKEGIRAKLTQKPSQPDIEKIKKDV